MQDKIYAVIDTNVIVSALFSREGNPANVIRCILNGRIVPLYNSEILEEYANVLSRDKFPFDGQDIANILNLFVESGISAERVHSGDSFIDIDDIVFYEVALSREGSFLVTGNRKHFPKKPFVVTPAEMMNIVVAFENREKNRICEDAIPYKVKGKE